MVVRGASAHSAKKEVRQLQRDPYDPTKPFNEQTKAAIVATHPKDGPITVAPHGKRFKITRDGDYWKGYEELIGVDGIGTKGALHFRMNTPRNGAQDVFAMVVDDLIEGGYIPVLFQDHIIIQEENHAFIFGIVSGLVDLSLQNPWRTSDGRSYPIAITGGETAILNTVEGFEVGLNVTGYVRKGHEITANVEAGDAIIGIESSGVHSNGLSFFRREFFDNRGMELDHALPWGNTVGEELTIPTRVYLPAIKELIDAFTEGDAPASRFVHGMVHITGGGFSKFGELIPGREDLDIRIGNGYAIEPQEIFRYVNGKFGMPSEKMYTTFNNGVGFAIAVSPDKVDEALTVLKRHYPAEVMGSVERGSGRIAVESKYDGATVEY